MSAYDPDVFSEARCALNIVRVSSRLLALDKIRLEIHFMLKCTWELVAIP